MPHLTFLGVGAIRPAVPGDHTALLIRHGDAHLLLDAGPAVVAQLARVGVVPESVTHVYFSHQHGDHTLGSPILLFYRQRRTYFAAPQVLDAWQALVEIAYPGLLPLFGEEVTLHPLSPDLPHPCPGLPGVVARLALAHHGHTPAFALRLDFAPAPGTDQRGFSLVYSGDTRPTEAVVRLAQGVDLLIHEATYLADEDDGSSAVHTSAREAGAIAAQAGARTLALVHRLTGNPDRWRQEAALAFPGPILIPQAGDTLSF